VENIVDSLKIDIKFCYKDEPFNSV